VNEKPRAEMGSGTPETTGESEESASGATCQGNH
jgi:hypothetical protein